MAAHTMIRCPNPEHDDNNPSCAVYDDGGAFCFSRCGYITQQQLKEWIGDNYATVVEESKRIARITHTHRGPSRDEGYRFCLLSSATLLTGPRNSRKTWFLERGFTESSISRFKFGHTGEHFVIPLWYNGEFHGYKLRRDERYCDPDAIKYLIPKGQKSVIVRPNPNGAPTVIVEGELDAYLLSQWGVDALTSSSGVGSGHDDLLRERSREWSRGERYVLFDADDAGEEAAKKIQERDRRFTILSLPTGNDITEYLVSIDPEQRGRAILELFRGR